jgi:two-component system, OmpR family, phosphate regulon sensor histidine kinase PhoR
MPKLMILSALGVSLLMSAIATASVLGLPALWGAVLGLTCAALGYFFGQNSAAAPPAPSGADLPPGDADHKRALQDMIGILDVPAFALDEDNAVAGANGPAREIFPKIAEGRLIHQISRDPPLLEAVQRARDLDTSQACEVQSRGPINRRLFASVTPMSSAVTAGHKRHLLLQFRDLTEQDRLMQLRTDFIANASHELRTPLASIKGFVETLQGPASGDAKAREKFLGIMQSQAARMTRILDDLLSLSRIEMREHVPPSEIIDIGAILRATVEGLEPLARQAHIALRYAPPAGTHHVRGDRDELVQVFQNLIQNAIKYGREDGNVEVTLAEQPGQPRQRTKIAVSVKDNGPGIAEEHLPRLTERFYRVDTATSRERGGTGLGLAIVKHIVSRHRGELKIDSALGKGSTFTVIFDAAA